MKIHKVVPAYGVEQASLEGWELVQVIQTSRGDKIQCMTPNPNNPNPNPNAGYNPNYNSSYQTTPLPMREEVVQVNEPVFLLARDAEIIAREKVLEEELRLLREKMQPLEDRHKNDARDIADLTKKNEELRTENQRLSRESMAALTEKREAAQTLTKLKTAIGTVRFDEILAK